MGGIFSGIGAKKAAKKQAQAAANAAAAQRKQQERARKRTERLGLELAGRFQPFEAQGLDAQNALAYELGLAGEAPTLQDGTTYAGYQLTPDYQFNMSEGLKALERGQAARGGVDSGAARKAVLRFSQGLASQGRNTYLDRLTGQGALGLNATQAAVNTRFGAGTQANNILLQQGNTNAAEQIAIGNAQAAGIQSLFNIPMNQHLLDLQTASTAADVFGSVGGLTSFGAA